MSPDSYGFVRKLAPQPDGRLLILSVCRHCGNFQISSHWDDSLDEWEKGHVCEPRTITPPWKAEQTG